MTLAASNLATPLGCDTHVHVIGDSNQFPMVQARHYTPGPASVADLQHHLQRHGLGRVVIIQPSVYGFDNSCLLAALKELGSSACGIAVLDPSISDLELKRLDAQGIRGIRLNFESSANQSVDQLNQALAFWAPRIQDLGWHIQVYAPFAVTAACCERIAGLNIPVVLDHFALWPALDIETEAQMQVRQLLLDGHIYIKLSASYRQANLSASHLTQLAHQMLQLRPDRLLWASDWPHTNREPGVDALSVSRYRDIEPAKLFKERHDWLATRDTQDKVMISNAERLYRF
jgi:predicted TIM-barrel fold metal-dependent hydrolase